VSFGLGGFFGLQSVLVSVSRRLALPFSGGLLETLLAGGIVILWVLIRNSRYESIQGGILYSRMLDSLLTYCNYFKLF